MRDLKFRKQRGDVVKAGDRIRTGSWPVVQQWIRRSGKKRIRRK